MEFGVHLPQLGRSADRTALLTWAEEADRLGLHSGWVSDHIAWPKQIEPNYPYSEDGTFPGGFDMPWLDPLSTLAFVAARTERIKLGTTVLILGYRPPVLTAKWMATLDVLSEGRAILGVGVGWMREEFEVLGMPFDNRGARADEQLQVFQTLFADDLPSYDGAYYRFPEVGFSPKPPNRRIPIWVGGSSEAAFRRTARFADGFHAAFEPVDRVAEEWAGIEAACESIGRDRAEITLSVRLHLDPAARMDPDLALQGSADRMAQRVGELAAIGVEHLVLDVVAPGGSDGRLDALRGFMADVAPGAA
ncbi:MAG: LLM class F420-dependent oxidoreductase [Actinomycetota bacterium]